MLLVFINLITLLGLLYYGADFVELTFNSSILSIEFLKIIGFTILSLIGIRIAIPFFRKRSLPIKKRIQISCLITILISAPLYVGYAQKIYVNRIEKRSLRKALEAKIEPVTGLAYGTKASHLTFDEYQEIHRVQKWFPKLQKGADSISYFYTYDGFLPDYSLSISYYLPVNTEIDSTAFKYGKLEIDTMGNRKRMTYHEYVD